MRPSPGQMNLLDDSLVPPKRAVTPAPQAAAERDAILAVLPRRVLWMAEELVEATGQDRETVRKRLEELRRNGRVRVRGQQKTLGGGSVPLWGRATGG